MLYLGMAESYSTVQAELKATRQLLVRFGHAPSVKLTLEVRPATAPPQTARVLRLARRLPVAIR